MRGGEAHLETVEVKDAALDVHLLQHQAAGLGDGAHDETSRGQAMHVEVTFALFQIISGALERSIIGSGSWQLMTITAE